MINIRNTLDYNQLRWGRLSGNVTGIWDKNNFFLGSSSAPIMKYHYLTANFVNFEKYVSQSMPKISYHLSGYGVNFNETLVSFLGESIERYTYSLLPAIIKDTVLCSSYESLVEKYGREDLICELEYINCYYTEEQPDHYIFPTDKIQWLPMNSLINPTQRVWMPLQFVVMYNAELFADEKKYLTSAVSTGTASHEIMVKSLDNALIEYLQIDSFNLWWYGGVKGKVLTVDLVEHLSIWFKKQMQVKNFLHKFNVTFTDISFDKSIYVVLCEIEAKDLTGTLPKYTVGLQGGYTLEQCIYRAFMECVTVLEFNMNVVWTEQEKFLNVTKDTRIIDNLDDNVLFYAKFGKPNLKHSLMQEETQVPRSKDLKQLLQKLSVLSRYAAFLHITPPGFKHMNSEVTRVIIPELLPIHLPSYPPYHHRRYKMIGGVVNNLPHPLA